MQAVPSLVGTGTAVAAAATGLVFAQPANESASQQPVSARPAPSLDRARPARPPSASRPPLSRPAARSVSYVAGPAPALTGSDRRRDVSNGSSNTASSSSSSARPPHIASSETSVAPSSTATLSRSTASAQGGFPGSWSRRHSFIFKGDWVPPPISEVSRDSISSNGSWIRRLSIRPLSQHGSPRSSVGPDSPSLNFSLSSAAPIVSKQSSTPPQQPSRNKLVKRTASSQEPAATSLSRRGSRSQMPTLRRPATSHQRSATLQQIPHPDEPASSSSNAAQAKFSFDQRARPSLAIFRLGAETPEPSDQDEPLGSLDTRASRDGFQKDEPLPAHEKGHGGSQIRWTSFFHGRITRTAAQVRGSSPFSNEGSPSGAHVSLPGRTIQVSRGQQPSAYLTHASALSAPAPGAALLPVAAALASPFQSPVAARTIGKTVDGNSEDVGGSPHGSDSSPQDTPSKKARRSISMNFSSPTAWMSKTGSIRRPKRGSDHPAATSTTGSPHTGGQLSTSNGPANGKRHVSAPVHPSRPSSALSQSQFQDRSVTAPVDLHLRKTLEAALMRPVSSGMTGRDPVVMGRSSPIPSLYADATVVPQRQRNSSSPLPPLSRLSSFNVDLSRLGASSSSSPAALATNTSASGAATQRDHQTHLYPGFATLPRSFPLVPRSRDISDERSSTLASSDLEFRGFASSGDDDDTDFKSDTVFDSVRTAASARLRSTDTPLESMFDESPPSTAGNSKTKRLSIQEILGQAWDSDTRIMEEEDEGFSTPIRAASTMPERSLPPSFVMRRFDGGYPAPDSQHAYADNMEANSGLASTMSSTNADVDFPRAVSFDFSRPSLEDDDDDDWTGMDDSGVTNHLSPPSRSPLHNSPSGMNGLFYNSSIGSGADQGSLSHHRSALSTISGNEGTDPLGSAQDERPRSNLFDWSESTVHPDKIDADGHSPRPKTVHGKQELELRNGRPGNRKGPVVAHIRSQSVPVNADLAEGAKPTTSKFGTWASGPKNASEDWDDDFDFGTSSIDEVGSDDGLGGFGSEEEDAFGQSSTVRAGRGGSASFAMIVPASIQATQPTVKAHSGQIRELSLLVDGLKRLCRHARDLNIVDESPSLWKEAENIIALASPDEDLSEAATAPKAAKTASGGDDGDVPRASIEFDAADLDEQLFMDEGVDAGTLNSFDDDDPFDTSDIAPVPSTPPPPEMSRTAVVRERQNVRRRSVFSPEDDIFGGGWPLAEDKSPARHEQKEPERPHTPERFTTATETPDSAMIESIMQAMQQQRSSSAPIRKSPVKQMSASELFFNTNTLQELVKRANTLFHTLSDCVRRAELFTQSPAVTPRHDRLNRREDGSPAFTRVFTDPSNPPKRLPKSQSGNSVVTHPSPSVETPTTSRVSQRLQMMTVN